MSDRFLTVLTLIFALVTITSVVAAIMLVVNVHTELSIPNSVAHKVADPYFSFIGSYLYPIFPASVTALTLGLRNERARIKIDRD